MNQGTFHGDDLVRVCCRHTRCPICYKDVVTGEPQPTSPFCESCQIHTVVVNCLPDCKLCARLN